MIRERLDGLQNAQCVAAVVVKGFCNCDSYRGRPSQDGVVVSARLEVGIAVCLPFNIGSALQKRWVGKVHRGVAACGCSFGVFHTCQRGEASGR
jgi:hypothetical protein